ncbi:MAG: GTPase Era [Candidatus Latescibacterota bacterium]
MIDIQESSLETTGHKCGFVAVVGLPNAGKSTLVNRYLKEKISIVSMKPQTTRTNITCILSTDTYQIIFVDTPGLLKPRYRMQEVMASFVKSAVEEADVLLVIIDASRFKGEFPPILVNFAGEIRSKKVVVALNKIDLIKKTALLDIIAKADTLFKGVDIIPISAIDGDGTDELSAVLLNDIPEGPSLFPEDSISSEPERFFVSELIREAVFLTMKEEIPYSSAVIIDNYEEKDDLVVIIASILIEKESQKPILIGKSGSMIKNIGTKARLGIEEFLGRKVFLDLRVKVKKDWRTKDNYLREIGLIRK